MISISDSFPWTWPVKVTIFDTRAGGLKVKHDLGKAKYDPEFDIPEYRLKKHSSKEPIRPPSLQYIVADTKGRDELFLVQLERNKFAPCMPPRPSDDEEIMKLKAKTDEDVVVNMWNRTIRKKKAMVYSKKSFWDTYGTIISVSIVGAVTLFSVIFLVNFMKKDMLNFEERLYARHQETLDKMTDVISVVVSNEPPITPTSRPLESNEPPPS